MTTDVAEQLTYVPSFAQSKKAVNPKNGLTSSAISRRRAIYLSVRLAGPSHAVAKAPLGW